MRNMVNNEVLAYLCKNSILLPGFNQADIRINIFEPEVISIGGGFVHFKDILLEKLVNKLNKEDMLFNNQAVPKIITAKLKNDAGIVGSVIEYKD